VQFKNLKLSTTQQVALFLQVFSKRAAGLLGGVDQWKKQQELRARDKPSGLAAEARVGIGVYVMQEKGRTK